MSSRRGIGMSKRTLWLVVATVLTVAAAVGWMDGAQPPDASAHGPVTVRLLIQESGKCMEHNQTPDVHAHRCWSPNNNQKWEIVPYGAYHYLRNQGNNECLDLPNWNPNDGVIFQTFPCNYQTAQLFIIPTCTACWGEIRNVSSGKCVDLQGAGLADETPFWQWPCSGVSYGTQWFYFDTHNLENDAIWGYHWYQRYPQTHNYTTWMTLSFDRQVLSGGSEWDGYVTNAVNAWNGPASTNTIYLAESPPVDWHDVHLAILGGDGCYFDGFGLNTCLNGAWGFTTWFGASKQPCCPPRVTLSTTPPCSSIRASCKVRVSLIGRTSLCMSSAMR